MHKVLIWSYISNILYFMRKIPSSESSPSPSPILTLLNFFFRSTEIPKFSSMRSKSSSSSFSASRSRGFRFFFFLRCESPSSSSSSSSSSAIKPEKVLHFYILNGPELWFDIRLWINLNFKGKIEAFLPFIANPSLCSFKNEIYSPWKQTWRKILKPRKNRDYTNLFSQRIGL